MSRLEEDAPAYDFSRPLTADEVAFAQHAFGGSPQAPAQGPGAPYPQTMEQFFASIGAGTAAPASTGEQKTVTVPLFEPKLIQPYAAGLTMATGQMTPVPVSQAKTAQDAKAKAEAEKKKAGSKQGAATGTALAVGAVVAGLVVLYLVFGRK